MKNGEIVSNELLKNDYFKICFYVPEICRNARAGQFVHVLIEENSANILRRPFSIHDVSEDGILTVVYKVVGCGTRRLSRLKPGFVCDIMGPLGNPYSVPEDDEVPVLVDGGYGVAATYLLAKNAVTKGVLLLGARSEADVILAERYHEAGFDVRISTNDGSVGHKGFVTELLPEVMTQLKGRKFRIYACGPKPMLFALARIMQQQNIPGEVSLDHVMCCGVGACFACVVKVKSGNPDGWEYARACKDGPVFDAAKVYTD